MNINDITRIANQYTDENFSNNNILGFVNDGISRINIELKSKLPFILNVTDEYTALDDSYIYSLLIPYACYGIKMNDGSLGEADRYLVMFNDNLEVVKTNKSHAIKEQYRSGDFSGIYKRDLGRGINQGWFGKR